MKKFIGIFFLGIILSTANVFCAGTMEAYQLAEGVNFDNRSEVLSFAAKLKSSQAVIAQAEAEGISIDAWIKNVIESLTAEYHSKLEKEAKAKKITDAEALAARNPGKGVFVMNITEQRFILDEYDKNKERFNNYVERYQDRLIQYTGERSDNGDRYSYDWSGNYYSGYAFKEEYIYSNLRLYRESGLGVIVQLSDESEESYKKLLSLNKGDIVTVVGKCRRIRHATLSDAGLPFGSGLIIFITEAVIK